MSSRSSAAKTKSARCISWRALLLQEESLVTSVLDKLEVDVVLLTDTVLESA